MFSCFKSAQYSCSKLPCRKLFGSSMQYAQKLEQVRILSIFLLVVVIIFSNRQNALRQQQMDDRRRQQMNSEYGRASNNADD